MRGVLPHFACWPGRSPLRGWLLMVLADDVVRVTGGRAGICANDGLGLRRRYLSSSERWAPTAATALGVLRLRAIRWSPFRSEGRAARDGRGRAGTGLLRAALDSDRGPAAAVFPVIHHDPSMTEGHNYVKPTGSA